MEVYFKQTNILYYCEKVPTAVKEIIEIFQTINLVNANLTLVLELSFRCQAKLVPLRSTVVDLSCTRQEVFVHKHAPCGEFNMSR